MLRQRFTVVLYICCSVTLFCVSAQFGEPNESNNNLYALPAYVIASRAGLLDSTTCGVELEDFRNAVNQRVLWGLKTLDSSGIPKPGFFYGNNFWLGSRSQCLDTMNKTPFQIAERRILNNTRYRNPQEEFPPFEVNYFVAHLRHNSTLQYHISLPNEDSIITFGICLPASCSVNNISFILESIFHDQAFLINELYSMDLSLIQVKDLKDDHQWLLNGGILLIFIALMLTFFMMISGTIYDIFIHQKYIKAKDQAADNLQNTIEEVKITDSLPLCEKNRIGNVLMCFSVYTNTKRIFNTKRDGTIGVIHGLRFLTMIWIILGHTVFYTIEYLDNKTWLIRFADGIPIQVISNMTVSVDTYFFLSGFLLSYVYLKNKINNRKLDEPINYGKKLKEFFMHLMKRFIRLTPPYMAMMGILILNSAWYDKTSQFYIKEKPHEICPKYWWRNLLYINNLFDHTTMCMSWSWYLSSDMQFFAIGLALLILSTIYFYTAVALLGALLIGSITISGYISYIYGYVPTLDEQYELLNILYYPPWVRIAPYIIGMITGYMILKLNKKVNLKKHSVILCWSLGSACNIFVLFGLYNRQMSVLSTALYIALSRSVWAIGIAWIVIVCFTKYAGIVKELLACKIWIPLSRLTYCAYLLNPFIIHSIRLHNETSAHLEFLTMSTMIMGHLAITYICAYALSLMAESPYILLTQMFSQPQNCKKKYKEHKIIIPHS